MSMTWLANVEKTTFWAHHAWSAFASLPAADRTIAVLPVFGYADHGVGLPLDLEEVVGSAVLRAATTHAREHIKLRVLPPLRFALAPHPSTFFGIDPETAHDQVREIAESVKAAGFSKLLFFVTSPWNDEFIDAASRDTRVALGLQTFVINAGGIGLDLHPASPTRADVQRLGSHLLATLPASSRPGEASDLGFRPGNFRQPAPIAATFSLTEAHRDGAVLLAKSAAHLARLIAEVAAREPLGSRAHRAPVALPGLASAEAGSVWPSRERHRYLTAHTRDALEALPEKDRALVIIPVGAIEQHGHHLPVGVDAILGQAWLDATLPKLAADAPVYVAPPITFGKSNEHVGFPGTVFISAKSLRRLLLALATQLRALGFRRIALLNTHGGNSAVNIYTLREIPSTLGLRAGALGSAFTPPLDPQEAAYGFHGGEWETSLMLAAAGELVDMTRAVSEFPARLDDPGELRPENAPAIFSWISKDVSTSGVMGDATRATEAKGREWLDAASSALAARIADLLAT